MEPERWQRIEEIFHAAMESAEHKRSTFLDHACAGDDLLRNEVQSLLSQTEKAANFIESPAAEIVARAIAGLLVRSIESGETRPIVLPSDFVPGQIWEIRWFPDGGKLLLTRRASVSEERSLWVVPVVGQAAPVRLRSDAYAPEISPDGKSLVFLAGPLHSIHDIWVSGLNGDSPRKLVSSEANHFLASPVWSPDGRWIAYLSTKGSKTSIELLPVEGGSPKTLLSESSLPAPEKFKCEDGTFGCLCWSHNWRLISVGKQAEISGQENYSLWQVRVEPTRGEPPENRSS